MDLPPLPGDPSLAGIGDGQAGPEPAIPRGPGSGGAPQGEEAEAARRKGLEAANRKWRSKAEEALVEALKRLQARGEAITAKALAREVSVHHTTASSRTLKAPDRPPGKPP
jgi:hypothetical protein